MNGVIFVYDIGNKDSFDKIKDFYFKLINKNELNNIVAIFVGNKSDIQIHKVNTDEALQFAKENKLYFFEASAKNKSNIQEIFSSLALNINKKRKEFEKNNLECCFCKFF